MAKWCVLVNGVVLLVVGIAGLCWIYSIPPAPPRWGEPPVDESSRILVGLAMGLLLFVFPCVGLVAQVAGVGRGDPVASKRARSISWAVAALFILVVIGLVSVQGGRVVSYRDVRLAWRALPFYGTAAVIEIAVAITVARVTRRAA